MPPIGVVVPRHIDELVEIHRVCREHGAPIVLRGGGTSLAGQGCNTAVLIDCSKYLHHILEIDPERRIARVQPGCVLDHLRGTATERHGLTFGPDPSTHAHCTLGGMLGNNSCGRALGAVGVPRARAARRGQPRGARGADLPRRAAAHRPRRHGRAGGDRATGSARSPTRTPTRSASAIRRSRDASRATTSTSCSRRTGSRSRRSLVGHRVRRA